MRRLVIDDHHITGMHGLTRRMHPVDKHPANPVIVPDRPWEGDALWAKNSTVFDSERGLFRMWYNLSPHPYGGYAESSDGIHWQKPSLGIVEHDGSRENNLVDTPVFQVIAGGDDFGDPDREQGFRTVNWNHEIGQYLACSADGLHWTPGEPLAIGAAGDTFLVVKSTRPLTGDRPSDLPGYPSLQDPARRYLGVVRWCMPVGEFDGEQELKPTRRVQTLVTSSDLLRWDDPVRILTPDELDDGMAHERIEAAVADGALKYDCREDRRCEFYTMQIVPYEDLYLGLLLVFDPAYEFKRMGAGNQAGPGHWQLVASRNLMDWRRVGERRPFIPRGGPGEFDWAMAWYCSLPILKEDQLWFFYCGGVTAHGGNHDTAYVGALRAMIQRGELPAMGSIGCATLRRDGFVSLDAGDTPGALVTKTFTWPDAGELLLNVDAGGGEVRVSVVQPDGTPYLGWEQSHPVSGDRRAAGVTWPEERRPVRHSDALHTHATEAEAPAAVTQSETLSPGQPARLRITLRNASLYSWWFA